MVVMFLFCIFFISFYIDSISPKSLIDTIQNEFILKTNSYLENGKDVYEYHRQVAIERMLESSFLVFDIDDTLVGTDETKDCLYDFQARLLASLTSYGKKILFLTSSSVGYQCKSRFFYDEKTGTQQTVLSFVSMLESQIIRGGYSSFCHQNMAFVFCNAALIFDSREGQFVVWEEFDGRERALIDERHERLDDIAHGVSEYIDHLLESNADYSSDINCKYFAVSSYRVWDIFQAGLCPILFVPFVLVNHLGVRVADVTGLKKQSLFRLNFFYFLIQSLNKEIPSLLSDFEGITYMCDPKKNQVTITLTIESKRRSLNVVKEIWGLQEEDKIVYTGDSFVDLHPSENRLSPFGVLADSSIIGMSDVTVVSLDPSCISFWQTTLDWAEFRTVWSILREPITDSVKNNILVPFCSIPSEKDLSPFSWKIITEVVSRLSQLQRNSNQERIALLSSKRVYSSCFSSFYTSSVNQSRPPNKVLDFSSKKGSKGTSQMVLRRFSSPHMLSSKGGGAFKGALPKRHSLTELNQPLPFKPSCLQKSVSQQLSKYYFHGNPYMSKSLLKSQFKDKTRTSRYVRKPVSSSVSPAESLSQESLSTHVLNKDTFCQSDLSPFVPKDSLLKKQPSFFDLSVLFQVQSSQVNQIMYSDSFCYA